MTTWKSKTGWMCVAILAAGVLLAQAAFFNMPQAPVKPASLTDALGPGNAGDVGTTPNATTDPAIDPAAGNIAVIERGKLVPTSLGGEAAFQPAQVGVGFGCQYTIEMWDDYGDGWNGGFIDVYVNGDLVLAGVTLESGAGPGYAYFEAGTGSEIQTVWTAGGWPYECWYCIHDQSGGELGCDGVGGVDPTGITVYGYCAELGACCDDETGVCDDDVEPSGCAYGRFVEGITCAELEPACGLWVPVGVLYCPSQPDNPAYRAALSAALLDSPVDYFDPRTATPSLELLSQYACVQTWANYSYADNVAMGDVLADYVDQGGKVILGQWCLCTAGNCLAGRIMTEYCPATATSYSSDSYAGDGFQCQTLGVTSFESGYFDQVTALEGAFSDGTTTNGNPFVLWNPTMQCYYSAGNTGLDYTTGDVAQLVANLATCTGELVYGACCVGGGCLEGLLEPDCSALGGVFGGAFSGCPFDEEPPTLVLPPDITIAHGDPTDPSHTGWAFAEDSFDPNPLVTYNDEVTGLVGCTGGTIYRAWEAWDACGNPASGVQIIGVEEDVCDDGDPDTYDHCDPYTTECGHGSDDPLLEPACDNPENRENRGGCTTTATCGNRGGGTTDSDPVHLFAGDFVDTVIDLVIAGRGTDFALTRTYRSRTGRLTSVGHNWDMSYAIELREIGSQLLFHDGGGRVDRFEDQPDGSWARAEYFRRIERVGPLYTMTHADRSVWVFSTVPGAPPDVYKLASITDRNGNVMTFEYDAEGRLAEVRDTLHIPVANERVITFSYNGDGFLESVTDWTGRQVQYEYYTDGDAGGSAGDLKSVTYPAVVATGDYPIPAGHEHPAGRTVTYTYTTGFDNDELNHFLLTITDGRRNDPDDPTFGDGPFLENFYAHTVDPGDPRYTEDPLNANYGRVVAQIYAGDRYDFVYVPDLDPFDPDNHGAVTKTIVNNRAGDVKELLYDDGNRLVARREYTGRALDPDSFTDLDADPQVNPPVDPLRPGDDPPVFETVHEWNVDSLLVRATFPNGNVVEYEYDSANPEPRARGNRLVARRLPGDHLPAGDQVLIEEFFEYDSDFGGCCGFNFVTRHTDGRGNDTLYEYDDDGNLVHIQHRIPSSVEDFEYNAYGQMTAHVYPDNGSDHRRRDEYSYYGPADGDQYGYLHETIVDAGGFGLTTTHEYNPVGQVVRTVDPRGYDTQFIVSQWDQIVRGISREVSLGGGLRYTHDIFHDANVNVARVDIENIDDQGVLQSNTHFTTIHEYDIANDLARTCTEAGSFDVPVGQLTCAGLPDSEFITTEYEYDANRNQTLVRFGEATNGNQPTNVVRTLYDERDLIFQQIRAAGNLFQSTTQHDYDANGNTIRVSRGLEDAPRLTTLVYDGYDRLVTQTNALGNVETTHYDANGNPVAARIDGELIDVAGDAGNIRLYEHARTYDELDRIVSQEVAFFDLATQTPISDGQSTTTVEWSDNSQPLRVVNDNTHETLTAYDTANRVSVTTDAKGNTATYAYDEDSNVTSITETEKSDLGDPDEVFTTTYTYDGLDRRITSSDNVSNTTQYGYDSRSNKTLMIDALGDETRYEYDGLNRSIRTIHDMNGNGADPGDPDDIVTAQSWDDTSRLIEQSDDADNPIGYVYDALNRRIAEILADGTAHLYMYDVHDNLLWRGDANGSVALSTYDLLDRLSGRTILPGSGVAPDTTFELYKYNGVSYVVHAEDDDSLVSRGHDSLFHLTSETLNGETTTSVNDGLGNQTQCVYPGGRTITCAYDELERASTMTDPAPVVTYDYVGPQRVARRDLGNGSRTDYSYDGITGVPNPPGDFGVKQIIRKRHTRVGDGAVLDDRTFTWDRVYNKAKREDVRPGGPQLTHDYTYDALERLIQSVRTPPAGAPDTINYTFDGVGNRTTVTGGPQPGAYILDATEPGPADSQVNQYTYTPTGRRSYDDNGNLMLIAAPGDCDGDGDVDADDFGGPGGFASCMSGPGNAVAGACGCYDLDHDEDADLLDFALFQKSVQGSDVPTGVSITYDYRNQMVEQHDHSTGLRHAYSYDALGRRIARIVDADGAATETRYFYNDWQVCEEQNEAGETEATYVYGLYIDEVLNMQRDVDGDDTPENYYHLADDRSNTTALVDADGSVVERYEYQDYGAPEFFDGASTPIPQSAFGNPYLFTGRRYDPETGWYYYRTRYLDPRAGRFTTRDAIGIWGDPLNAGNGYVYVGNNPWSWLDPTGRETVDVKDKDGNKVGTIDKSKTNCIGYAAKTGGGLYPIEEPADKRTSLKQVMEALGYKCTKGISALNCKAHCKGKEYLMLYVYINKRLRDRFDDIHDKYKDKDPYADPIFEPSNIDEIDYHGLQGQPDGNYKYQGHNDDKANEDIKDFKPTKDKPDYFGVEKQMLAKYCCCKDGADGCKPQGNGDNGAGSGGDSRSGSSNRNRNRNR